MSGVEEIQQQISAVQGMGETAVHQIHAAQETLESATALLANVSQGSHQPELVDGVGTLQQVRDDLKLITARISDVTDTAMDYARRL